MLAQIFIGKLAGKQNAKLEALGLSEITVSNKEGAQTALAIIDNAIESVSGQRASLGAIQNRLQSTVRNLEIHKSFDTG